MTSGQLCCVCGDSADESNSSECYGCGQPYHLNQRNDQEGRDCGDVWISSATLALEFGCRTCIDAANAEQSPADPAGSLQRQFEMMQGGDASAIPPAAATSQHIVEPVTARKSRTRRYRRRE